MRKARLFEVRGEGVSAEEAKKLGEDTRLADPEAIAYTLEALSSVYTVSKAMGIPQITFLAIIRVLAEDWADEVQNHPNQDLVKALDAAVTRVAAAARDTLELGEVIAVSEAGTVESVLPSGTRLLN